METVFLFLYLTIIPDIDKKLEQFPHVKCMAQNAYYETDNNDFLGRVAMSQTVMNRVKVTNFSKFPGTVCDVVYKYKQFSWYWDGKSDKMHNPNARRKAYIAAAVAMMDLIPNMVGESVYYYSLEYKKPWWEPYMIHHGPIGRHQFMLESKELVFEESVHLLVQNLRLRDAVRKWGIEELQRQQNLEQMDKNIELLADIHAGEYDFLYD